MITKGVRQEVLITLDKHFKHYHVPRTPEALMSDTNVWFEWINWDYIQWLYIQGETAGNISSNTGEIMIVQTTDGAGSGTINFTKSNQTTGTHFQEFCDCRAITGKGKLQLNLNSGENAVEFWLKNFDVHRVDNLTYPV